MPPDAVLRHLKALVEIYPETNDQTSVKRGLDYCKEIIDNNDALDNAKIHEYNGYYSLTASTKTNKPKLLLQAHIDVVRCLQKPEIYQSEDSISGRGVYDMLFAVACYLSFIEMNSGALQDLDIGLMITGDEEIGGFNGVKKLVEAGYSGEVVFLPDACEGFGDLSVAAKGAYNFDLVASGKAHHGSRPWEGDGAGNKLIHMTHELMDSFDHSDTNNSTITITRFDGGGAINRGPSSACAHVDIRFKDMDSLAAIEARVEDICNKYGGSVKNMLRADSMEINTEEPAIKEFVELYAKHNGKPISFSKAHGGSDARFFYSAGTPVIMIRPDGGGAHSDEESLDLASLAKFYALLEEFILKTAKIN